MHKFLCFLILIFMHNLSFAQFGSNDTGWQKDADSITTSLRIGIGTTGPLSKLHVVGTAGTLPAISSATLGLFDNSGASTAYLSLFAQNGTGINFGVPGDEDQASLFWNSSTPRFQFRMSAITSLILRRSNDGPIIDFYDRNSVNEDEPMASIEGWYDDPPNGAEDGRLEFNVKDNGTLTEKMLIDSSAVTISAILLANNVNPDRVLDNSFVTIATTDTTTYTGATTNSRWSFCGYRQATASTDIIVFVEPVTDGVVVHRIAGTTSGAAYTVKLEKL